MTWLFLNWRWAVPVAALLLAVTIAGVQTKRIQWAKEETAKIQRDFDKFKGGVAALGEKAKAEAAAKETADKQRKDKADAENKRTADSLRADVARMRRERDSAGRSFVPAITTCPASPAEADQRQAEYQRAYRELVRGIRELGDEADGEIVDLNSAKRWAQ